MYALSFRGSAYQTQPNPTQPTNQQPPIVMKQVWFSWQVDVNQVSIQLSQPTLPPSLLPPLRMGKVAPGPSPSPSLSPAPSPSPSPSLAQEEGSGIPLRPVPQSQPHTGDAEGSKEQDRGDGGGGDGVVVLLLVVSGARARVGIRTEKGFVMDGSVHAVEGSGVGGTTCLSISPAVLWGGGREGGGFCGRNGSRKSMGRGEEGG